MKFKLQQIAEIQVHKSAGTPADGGFCPVRYKILILQPTWFTL